MLYLWFAKCIRSCYCSFNVRDGINIFLDGYIPTENVRLEIWHLRLEFNKIDDIEKKLHTYYSYPNIDKTHIK